jgi:hypothetical protein
LVETGQKPTKVCVKCGEVKALDLFGIDRRTPTGRRSICRACRITQRARRASLFPEQRNREYGAFVKRKYGLTWDAHEALILRAAGYCDSCGNKFAGAIRGGKSICIDHCHTTKDVRGLLCGKCNTSAGNLADCPDTIFSLIKYIMETRYNPFLKSEALHFSKKTT